MSQDPRRNKSTFHWWKFAVGLVTVGSFIGWRDHSLKAKSPFWVIAGGPNVGAPELITPQQFPLIEKRDVSEQWMQKEKKLSPSTFSQRWFGQRVRGEFHASKVLARRLKGEDLELIWGGGHFDLSGISRPFTAVGDLIVSDFSPLDAAEYLESQRKLPEARKMAAWLISEANRSALPTGEQNRLWRLVERHGRESEVGYQWARQLLDCPLNDTTELEIERERAWQNLNLTPSKLPLILPRYEELVLHRPSATAWYLRGRLAVEPTQAEAFFNKAIQADSQAPWPRFALGYLSLARGNFAEAKATLQPLASFEPASESLWTARFALGEFTALTAETRQAAQHDPLNGALGLRLLELASAKEATKSELHSLAQELGRRASTTKALTAPQVAQTWSRFAQLLSGDTETLLSATAQDSSREGKLWRFWALMESGQIEAATAIFPLNEATLVDPAHYLTVSLAYLQQSKVSQAQLWTDKAAELFSKLDFHGAKVSDLLKQTSSASVTDIETLVQPPGTKGLIAAWLAYRWPETADQMSHVRDRFNVRRSYPWRLLRKK